MKKDHYFVYKDQNNNLCYIDYSKLQGFKVNPLNKVEYDGIEVNELVIIKPSFIDKVLKKKIKRKLDYYLKLIIELIDNTDNSTEEDGSKLAEALNEITKYRNLIQNTYRRYLEERYIELLLTKISLLEQELKSKILYKPVYGDEYVEERKRSR